MSAVSALLLFVSLVAFVAGQLLLKRAMQATAEIGHDRRAFGWLLFAGICAMSVSFFLTLGLLRQFDLSYLYPFQGLSVIFITIAAAWILRERISLSLAIGSLLITAGVVLVALS